MITLPLKHPLPPIRPVELIKALFPADAETKLDNKKFRAAAITCIVSKDFTEMSLKQAQDCASQHYQRLSEKIEINSINKMLTDLFNEVPTITLPEINIIVGYYGYSYSIIETPEENKAVLKKRAE